MSGKSQRGPSRPSSDPSMRSASREGPSSNSAALEAASIGTVEAPAEDVPRQATGDIDALYEAAATAMVTLGSETEALAAGTGGSPKIPDALKGRKRAMEKIDNDYGGDASRIVDLARASVFYDEADQLMSGVAEVRDSWAVVREKDRFENPAGGYRDIMFNVDIGGHVCELQLHLTKIIEAKKEGHHGYERISELKRKLKRGDGLTEEEDAELKGLQKDQWKLYNDAFADAGGEVKDEHRAKEG